MNVSRATDEKFFEFSDTRQNTREKHALYLLEDALRRSENRIRDNVQRLRDRVDGLERYLEQDESSIAFLRVGDTAREIDEALSERQATWQMLGALLTSEEIKVLLEARKEARQAKLCQTTQSSSRRRAAAGVPFSQGTSTNSPGALIASSTTIARAVASSWV